MDAWEAAFTLACTTFVAGFWAGLFIRLTWPSSEPRVRLKLSLNGKDCEFAGNSVEEVGRMMDMQAERLSSRRPDVL